jgi:hypothetical protein
MRVHSAVSSNKRDMYQVERDKADVPFLSHTQTLSGQTRKTSIHGLFRHVEQGGSLVVK